MYLTKKDDDEKDKFMARVSNPLPPTIVWVTETIAGLTQTRERNKHATHALFVLSMKYSRGVDLKLGTDSHVLVVVNEDTRMLTTSIVKQMVGRSTRRMRISKGTFIASKDVCGAFSRWEDYCKSNDTISSDGHKIL